MVKVALLTKLSFLQIIFELIQANKKCRCHSVLVHQNTCIKSQGENLRQNQFNLRNLGQNDLRSRRALKPQ